MFCVLDDSHFLVYQTTLYRKSDSFIVEFKPLKTFTKEFYTNLIASEKALTYYICSSVINKLSGYKSLCNDRC